MEDQQIEAAIEHGRVTTGRMLTLNAAASRHSALRDIENQAHRDWRAAWNIARVMEHLAQDHPGEPLPDWARGCLEAAERAAWDRFTEATSRSAAALAVYEGAVKAVPR